MNRERRVKGRVRLTSEGSGGAYDVEIIVPPYGGGAGLPPKGAEVEMAWQEPEKECSACEWWRLYQMRWDEAVPHRVSCCATCCEKLEAE